MRHPEKIQYRSFSFDGSVKSCSDVLESDISTRKFPLLLMINHNLHRCSTPSPVVDALCVGAGVGAWVGRIFKSSLIPVELLNRCFSGTTTGKSRYSLLAD